MRFFNSNEIVKRNSFVLLLFAFFVIVKFTGALLDVKITALLIFLFFVAVIGICFSNRKLVISNNRYSLLLTIFLILTVCSLSWTNAFEYGGKKTFILVSILFVFSLFCQEFKNNSLLFFKYFSFFFALTLVYILVYHLNNITKLLFYGNIYRYRVIEGLNPNVVSAFFAFGGLSYIMIFIKSKVKFIKRSSLFLSAVCILLLLMTGSRGCLIAFLGSLISFYLICFVENKVLWLGYITLLFVCPLLFGLDLILFFYDLMPDSVGSLYQNRYMSDFSLEAIFGRFELVKLAWESYISFDNIFYLLFGRGIGSFGYLINGVDRIGYPHNIFLEILYELGFFGFIIFLAIILRIIFYSFSFASPCKRKNINSNILFFNFLFINSLSTGDIASNYLLFIFIIILLLDFDRSEKLTTRKLNAR